MRRGDNRSSLHEGEGPQLINELSAATTVCELPTPISDRFSARIGQPASE
eukprot:COSAG03_NODE_23129_length_283_cov_0.597826_1_plen_49_part_01